MKLQITKLGFFSLATFGLALTTTFTACGDSNTTEVTEQTGMDVLAKGEKMPDCTKDNAGDMLYVADSAAAYYCVDGEWATLNGKDGEPGEPGASAESKAGASCTAETVKDGIKISCEGKEIGTIKNGEPGESATGEDGDDCSVTDNGDGEVVVKCGENGTPVTLYKAMCGTNSYDPEEMVCYEGTVYEKGASVYDATKNTLVDLRDNQVYKTVTIEKMQHLISGDELYSEIWMAENLNYKVTDSWCYNEGVAEVSEAEVKKNCETYGRLYSWAAAMDSEAEFSDVGKGCGYGKTCDVGGKTVRGVCPSGWHLPSYGDWIYLKSLAGISQTGYAFKSSTGWVEYNGRQGGDDTFEFTALPAGARQANKEGIFNYRNIGEGAYFWSALESEKEHSYAFTLSYKLDDASVMEINKLFATSVRCLKDKPSASSASN